MLRIWGRTTSINVQKVMWAVAELGLAHERIDAGGVYGGLDRPAYRAMNPNGLVPTIDDDGAIVWESHAIVRYLAARYGVGSLCPEDWATRAVADQWMDWMITTLNPGLSAVFWALVRTSPSKQDADQIAAAAAQAARPYGLLDAHLAKRPFVAGDSLTMGDIAIGPTLFRYFTMEIERPPLANVEAYYARLQVRPAFRQHAMVSYESLRARDA